MDLDYSVVGHVRDATYIEVSGDEQPMPELPPVELLGRIAVDILGIETLDARASDDLDSHQLGVRSIGRALEAAFEAGRLSRRGEDRRAGGHDEAGATAGTA